MSQKEIIELLSMFYYKTSKEDFITEFSRIKQLDTEKQPSIILDDIENIILSFYDYKEGSILKQEFKNEFIFGHLKDRKISPENKIQDLNNVVNKDSIFYDKKVVVSGEFEKFIDRNKLASILKNLGADVNGAISKKTNYFIIGDDYGPRKMEKVQQYIADGFEIIILPEEELYKILSDLNSL